MKKIRISAVSYLNTFPFLYGLYQDAELMKIIDLSTDYPSICANKLLNDKVDIGLVPIAILPEMKFYKIITNYCIAAENDVKSVILASDVELSEIKNIYLDFQSRTSVMLTKILAKFYWNKNFNWLRADENYIEKINDDTAGIIIGDRALNVLNNYKFIYDLSSEWKKFTGLPFVFATWTANKYIPNDIIDALNEAFRKGIENIDKVVSFFDEKIQKINYNAFEYYNNNISYVLDDKKFIAINKYLDLLPEVTH